MPSPWMTYEEPLEVVVPTGVVEARGSGSGKWKYQMAVEVDSAHTYTHTEKNKHAHTYVNGGCSRARGPRSPGGESVVHGESDSYVSKPDTHGARSTRVQAQGYEARLPLLQISDHPGLQSIFRRFPPIQISSSREAVPTFLRAFPFKVLSALHTKTIVFSSSKLFIGNIPRAVCEHTIRPEAVRTTCL